MRSCISYIIDWVKKMLIKECKRILRDPGRLKTLSLVRPHVLNAFERYLINNRGIISQFVCSMMNISYVLLKKDKLATSGNTRGESEQKGQSQYLLTDLLQLVSFNKKKFFERKDISCTIVIPVYNGLEHLKRLLPSLERNTHKDAQILIINDNSPDSRVSEFLQGFKSHPGFQILDNESNLGFVGTINRAMSLVRTDFAVWLNSDTVVPEYWLERLLAPFEKEPKLATATPFTNSGVIFSYPNFGQDNELKFSLQEVDRAFQKIEPTDNQLEETYSGTGFCMAINMKCWKDVGDLDIEAFGKGYGEENDWCMRATQKGWKHKLVNNLFVHHCHGGSFLSEEKRALCNRNRQILISRYPKVMLEEVPSFFEQDPWRPFRQIVSLLLSNKDLTLFIDLKSQKNDVSGALDYSKREIQNLEKSGERVVTVTFERFSDEWSISPISVDKNCSIKLKGFSEIKWLFYFMEVKRVIINNLAFLKTPESVVSTICRLKQEKEFKLEYRWHDNLALCPSFFLLTSENYPCQVIDPTYCQSCLPKNTNRIILREDIVRWRFVYSRLFSIVDNVRFFSEYSLKTAIKVYPQIIGKHSVVEHSPLIRNEDLTYELPKIHIEKQINIGFIGNFCPNKGSVFFNKLSKEIKKYYPNCKFFILGITDGSQEKDIVYLGKYDRSNLGQKLTDYCIHLVIHPSIANETFSYTAQELMLLGVPFVVFPCGAPAERVKKYQYKLAEVAEAVDQGSLLRATLKLIEKLIRISDSP